MALPKDPAEPEPQFMQPRPIVLPRRDEALVLMKRAISLQSRRAEDDDSVQALAHMYMSALTVGLQGIDYGWGTLHIDFAEHWGACPSVTLKAQVDPEDRRPRRNPRK